MLQAAAFGQHVWLQPDDKRGARGGNSGTERASVTRAFGAVGGSCKQVCPLYRLVGHSVPWRLEAGWGGGLQYSFGKQTLPSIKRNCPLPCTSVDGGSQCVTLPLSPGVGYMG